jgi:hypothetical protein
VIDECGLIHESDRWDLNVAFDDLWLVSINFFYQQLPQNLFSYHHTEHRIIRGTIKSQQIYFHGFANHDVLTPSFRPSGHAGIVKYYQSNHRKSPHHFSW